MTPEPQRGSEDNGQGAQIHDVSSKPPRFRLTPIRLNLLIIAVLIAVITGGLLAVLWKALEQPGENSFIIGAIIGLVGGGITGLVSLGTTLLNDK